MLNIVFCCKFVFVIVVAAAHTRKHKHTFMPTHTPFMKLLLQHKSVVRAKKQKKNKQCGRKAIAQENERNE